MGVAKVKGNIQALACALQLMSFESSSLTIGDWQAHLLAANSLIPALMEAWSLVLESGPFASSIWPGLDSRALNATQNQNALSFEYLSALKFFANILIAFGTLSCISIGRSSPFIYYQCLINQPGLIQMNQLIGCKNWVLLTILEVGMLDKWKREELERNRLSFKTLSHRGAVIESAIESGLREASGNTATSLITSIYATSARTYLHMVVSGLNPILTEVKDSVCATTVLLKKLPDPRAVQNIIWPLAITGCMAMQYQEDFFRGLLILSEAKSHVLQSSWALVRVWEKT